MSINFAPTSRAIFKPSPVVWRPRVAGKVARSGRYFSNKLSDSSLSRPKPPEAMRTDGACSDCLSGQPVTSTSTSHSSPAFERFRPTHFVFFSRQNWSVLSVATCSNSLLTDATSSAPTKPFEGRKVRFTVCPPNCARIDKSTPVRFLSQSTAGPESFANFSIRSVRARVPALFVVSATSDSTEVSNAVLMPDDAFPELPPRKPCFSTSTTLAPLSKRVSAADMPARPLPMMTLSMCAKAHGPPP
mmetsp:Transcript_5212/g.14737  ORF Transcript_5212/g.14737 Transcript_5212/m.14737 type:complete len:245 (+) Transcript_5212:824-1558(+)